MKTLRSQLRGACQTAAALAAQCRENPHDLLMCMEAFECEHALSTIEARVVDARRALKDTTTTSEQLARFKTALSDAVEVVTWTLDK